MGILGELNQMVKAGSMEQFHTYLTNESNLSRTDAGTSANIDLNDSRTAGAHRRSMHHDAEISIASHR
ncbi:MAG: hypothetical protein SPE16_04825 [Butyricicoccus porcorum]|nr:hypothetical protein [Butyricicoccus porcorum]